MERTFEVTVKSIKALINTAKTFEELSRAYEFSKELSDSIDNSLEGAKDKLSEITGLHLLFKAKINSLKNKN